MRNLFSLPALILVSPLSGIPGAPSIGALIIVTVVVQALVGRQHLWLTSHAPNIRAQAFYRREGFVETGTSADQQENETTVQVK